MDGSETTFSAIALLVDGDNVPASYAGQILRKARTLGKIRVTRVYGNASGLAAWSQAPSYRLVHAGNAKNGADLLLAIDAMELALREGFEAFVVVSSDRDFSHLAHRLRELGRHVLGIGEEGKAPAHFLMACSARDCLKAPAPAAQDPGLSRTDRAVMEVIREMDSTGTGALVTNLNAQMRRLHNLKISEHADKSWARHFKNREDQYRIVGEGSEKRVLIAGLPPESS